MKYFHIRHAAGILYYGNKEILIDPMLSPKGANPPIKNSWNSLRNPLIDLPFDISASDIPDYCLVTHLHTDHFDMAANEILPKDINLICQSENEGSFKEMNFKNIFPIEDKIILDDLVIKKVPGSHGTGEISKLMGTSSGYILSSPSEPTLYITGDTIFYDSVESTLKTYLPEIVIAFGGTAQFSEGDPITLSPQDILKIHQTVPNAKIICVHMDSINHCRTRRSDLLKFIQSNTSDLEEASNFIIAKDGETVLL